MLRGGNITTGSTSFFNLPGGYFIYRLAPAQREKV